MISFPQLSHTFFLIFFQAQLQLYLKLTLALFSASRFCTNVNQVETIQEFNKSGQTKYPIILFKTNSTFRNLAQLSLSSFFYILKGNCLMFNYFPSKGKVLVCYYEFENQSVTLKIMEK